MPSRRKPPPVCGGCGADLIFIRVANRLTLAFDKAPVDTGGTVAAYSPATGGMVGRWISQADAPFSHEKRYQAHKCPKPPPPEPQPMLFDLAK